MEFIIDHWYLIVSGIGILVCLITGAIKFIKTPTSEQLTSLREWLLFATTKAEKELGSGTGQLKLRFVYDMFVNSFPWLARLIRFERFSEMVDNALATMNEMLAKKPAVQQYVLGEVEDYETEDGENE